MATIGLRTHVRYIHNRRRSNVFRMQNFDFAQI